MATQREKPTEQHLILGDGTGVTTTADLYFESDNGDDVWLTQTWHHSGQHMRVILSANEMDALCRAWLRYRIGTDGIESNHG